MIYNVKVSGISIGMTFNKAEADSWVAQSSSKYITIHAVPHPGA